MSDTAPPEDTAEPPDPLDEIDVDALPAGSSPCREPVKGEVKEITDGDTIKVDAEFVRKNVGDLAKNTDLSRYIL